MAANKSRASSSLKKKGNVINMDAESSKGDTVVFALAIALGVAMIVVIVLICVYANKRNSNGNDDSDGNCQGSEDTKYIEIDVLTQETPTTVLAESAHAHPQHHKVPHTHPHPHLNHQVPHPHPLPEIVLAATHSTGKGPTHVKAQEVAELVAATTSTYVFVHSNFCGACKRLNQEMHALEAEGKDVSSAHFLSTEEVSKLPSNLKSVFESQYILTLFKVGSGTVVKEQVGAPSSEKLREYFVKH